MPTETDRMVADQEKPVYTLAEGQPTADPKSSLMIRSRYGNGGIALLRDTQLIETLAHFPRERIPERAVHAKAAGAWGEFEVTHDVSDLTCASFLEKVGKKTPLLARISTVGGEKGSSDTVRDVRGWAMKIYTDEGNQDFVFNDLPVFFIRDPIKFPSMNRSHKKHPRTNVPDATMFWDYHNNNQEGIHALMHLFGNRGIPSSLRHINAFGVHTYKLVKKDGTIHYIKWHIKPDAGVTNLPAEEALRLAGAEPDYHVKDLFDAIEKGDYPTYTLSVQVMTIEQAQKYRYNIFDDTVTWPHHDYPLRPVGKITFNKNPDNYFQDIEQAAFSPSNMVPGIAPSADIMLQARMFSYPDAARYRVGPNYQQWPPNKARSTVYSPYQRDGPGTVNGNYGADPDYVGSSLRPISIRENVSSDHDEWVGKVVAHSFDVTDQDFEQARELWKIICGEEGGEKNFIENLAGNLGGADPAVRKESLKMFAKVDEGLAKSVEKAIG